jgi:hypothetical protein
MSSQGAEWWRASRGMVDAPSWMPSASLWLGIGGWPSQEGDGSATGWNCCDGVFPSLLLVPAAVSLASSTACRSWEFSNSSCWLLDQVAARRSFTQASCSASTAVCLCSLCNRFRSWARLWRSSATCGRKAVQGGQGEGWEHAHWATCRTGSSSWRYHTHPAVHDHCEWPRSARALHLPNASPLRMDASAGAPAVSSLMSAATQDTIFGVHKTPARELLHLRAVCARQTQQHTCPSRFSQCAPTAYHQPLETCPIAQVLTCILKQATPRSCAATSANESEPRKHSTRSDYKPFTIQNSCRAAAAPRDLQARLAQLADVTPGQHYRPQAKRDAETLYKAVKLCIPDLVDATHEALCQPVIPEWTARAACQARPPSRRAQVRPSSHGLVGECARNWLHCRAARRNWQLGCQAEGVPDGTAPRAASAAGMLVLCFLQGHSACTARSIALVCELEASQLGWVSDCPPCQLRPHTGQAAWPLQKRTGELQSQRH